MKTAYLLLLVLALWFCPTEQQSCHTSELDLCAMPTILKAKNLFMPRNGSMIKKNCIGCTEAWKCVDNYESKCMSDTNRMMSQLIRRGPRKVYQEYCDPTSKLRIEYEKHLPCLSDAVALTFQTCTDNLENVIYMISADDAEDRVNAGCCYFRRFYDCLERNTIKLCGKSSFEPIKDAVNVFHFDTINSVCKFYDPEDKMCKDYLTRDVPAPTDSASYLGRLAVRYLRFLQ